MDSIPNIITEKDNLYLKDLFYKNFYLFKEVNEVIPRIKDNKIKELFERIKNMHEDHMYFIISSLRKENTFIGDEDE